MGIPVVVRGSGRSSVLAVLVVLVAAVVVGRAGDGVSDAGPLAAAVERVAEEGSYRFRSSVVEVVDPAPTVTNAGRSGRTRTLSLDGVVDLDASATEISVSSGQPATSVGVRVVDGVTWQRRGDGPWVETATAAETGVAADPLGLLGAARDLTVLGAETLGGRSVTRYGFSLDAASFARVSTERSGVAESAGALPPDLTGTGEVWVSDDGLPLRQTMSLRFGGPAGATVTTETQVDFSEFSTATVPGVSRTAAPWWSFDPLGDHRGEILLLLAALGALLVWGAATRAAGASPLSPGPVAGLLAVGLFAGLVLPARVDASGPSSTVPSLAPAAESAPASTDTEQLAAAVRAYESSNLADPHLDRLASVAATPSSVVVTEPDPADKTSDLDADGLTDFVEFSIGTDPEFADSDGDTIPDDVEVVGFTVPCDAEPVAWFGDPLSNDSNADGAPDTVDGVDDTDGDCLPDMFDDDNDADGIPDRIDSAPATAAAGGRFDEDHPLDLVVDGLATDADLVTFVDFQVVLDDPTQLNYAPRVGESVPPRRHLDWPSDTDGQIQDLLDGVDDEDITLIPMLEITVPTGHALPGEDDPEPYGPLEAYGIEVGATDPSTDTRPVYVPLTLLSDPITGAGAGLTGRMMYSSRSDWSVGHQTRLLWLVQVANDIPCDPDADNAVELGCTSIGPVDGVETGYVYDRPQIVQAYYEPWTLGGLSVTEEHGTDLSVIHEDPALDDDLTNHLPTWGLGELLTERFLATSPGTDTFEITEATLADRIDHDLLAGRPTQADLPDVFQVDTAAYPTLDAALNGAAQETIPALLDQVFTPELGGESFQPLITVAYMSTTRGIGLDAGAGYVAVDGHRVTFDLDFDLAADGGTPTQTVGTVKWNAYCAQSGTPTWTTCTLDQVIADVDRDSEGFVPYDPDDPTQPLPDADPDLADGELQLARLHAAAMVTGVTVPVRLTTPDGRITALQESNKVSDGLFYGLARGGQAVTGEMIYPLFARRAYDKMFAELDAAAQWGRKATASRTSAREAIYSLNRSRAVLDQVKAKTVVGRVSAWKARSPGVAGAVIAVAVIGLLSAFIAVAATEGLREGISTGVAIGLAVGMAALSAQATSQVVALGKVASANGRSLSTVLGGSTQKLLGVSQKAGAIGFVVFAVIRWGFFIVQMASSDVTAFSPEFNGALAAVLAETLYVALLTVLSLTVVGTVIVAIVALVDALIGLFCADDDGDCTTISGSITDALTVFLYGTDPMIDVNAADLVSVKRPTVTLGDPAEGFVAGNSLTVTVPVDTTVTHTAPSAWQMVFYTWMYSESNIRSSNFNYELSAPDEVDAAAATTPGTWDSVTATGTSWAGENLYRATRSETVEIDATDVISMDQAGINQEFDYHLNSAYNLPSYECWTVPGPPPFIVVPVCYTRRIEDTTSSDMPPLVYDVLPATLASFLGTEPRSGGQALAWDDAFEPIADLDGDGLLAFVRGGLDPDDTTPDADGDGLTDRRELELRARGSAVSPSSADPDGDGLNDRDELAAATDPATADSDNDGLADGVEVRHLVTDGDGVTRIEGGWDVTVDGLTVRVFSNPSDRDGDRDGITDQAERQLATSADPDLQLDGDGWPYHPGVWNAVPIGVVIDAPTGFVAAGSTVDITTTVTTDTAIAPSFLDVTWPTEAGASPPPALLDFDPDTFVSEQVRAQTTTLTVPEGLSSIEVDAGVRAWLPDTGPPVVSVGGSSGSLDLPTSSVGRLINATPVSLDEFLVSDISLVAGSGRFTLTDPVGLGQRTFESDPGLWSPVSSACNDAGTCLGVWRLDDGTSRQLWTRTVSASGNLGEPRRILSDANAVQEVRVASDGTAFAAIWSRNGSGSFMTFDSQGFPQQSESEILSRYDFPSGEGAVELLWVDGRYVAITTTTPWYAPDVNCLEAECSAGLRAALVTAYDMSTLGTGIGGTPGRFVHLGLFNRTAYSPLTDVFYDPISDSLLVVGHPVDSPTVSDPRLAPLVGRLTAGFSDVLSCPSGCSASSPYVELFASGHQPVVSFDSSSDRWVVTASTVTNWNEFDRTGDAFWQTAYFDADDLVPDTVRLVVVGAVTLEVGDLAPGLRESSVDTSGGQVAQLPVACPGPWGLPVLDLGFEELPGATTFVDGSRSGLDTSSTPGSAPYAGASGAPNAPRSRLAARFAGPDAEVTVATPMIRGDGRWSLAFWIRVDDDSSSDPFTISWDDTHAVSVRPDTGVVEVEWGVAVPVTATTPVNDGDWHLVTVTSTGLGNGVLTLTVDGSAPVSRSGSDVSLPSTVATVAGGGSAVTIDQLRFYNSVLDADAVADLRDGTPVEPACMTVGSNSTRTAVTWRTWKLSTSDTRGGEFGSTADALSLRVDGEAPTTSVSVPSTPVGSAVPYVLAGTASDGLDGSGVALVEVSLDGGPWTEVDGTEAWTISVPLGSDDVEIRTRATDAVGNVEVPGAATVLVVDDLAPTVTLNPLAPAVSPDRDPATGALSVALSGTVSDAGAGMADGGAVEVSVVPVNSPVDPSSWQSAVITGSAWSSHHLLPPDRYDVGEGFSVRVRAVDAIGNRTSDDAAGTVVVLDNRAPEVTLSEQDAAAPFLTGSTELTGSASDGSGAGLASVEVSFTPFVDVRNDAASDPQSRTWRPATVEGAVWSLPVPAGFEGLYQVDLRATDALGNRADVDGVWRGLIDSRAPRVSLEVQPTGQRRVRTGRYEVSYRCRADDLFLDVPRFDCPGETTRAVTLGFLPESELRTALEALFPDQVFYGEAELAYRQWESTSSPDVSATACDQFGNCATEAGAVQAALRTAGLARPVAVDPAPNAVLVAPGSGDHVAVDDSVDVTVAVEAAASVKSVEVFLDGSSAWRRDFAQGSTDAFESVVVVPDVPGGEHTLSVTVVDWNDDSDESAEVTFFADTSAPVLTLESEELTADDTWAPGSDVLRFDGLLTDDGVIASVQVRIGERPWTEATFGNGVWSIALPVPDADGTSVALQVRAVDLAGRTTRIGGAAQVDLAPPAVQPYVRPGTIAVDGPAPVGTSTSASFEFDGTRGDAEVAQFECRVDGAPFTRCSSPWSIDDLAGGDHVFEVRAVDVDGYVDLTPASWGWAISAVGPQPTLGSTPDPTTTSRSAEFAFASVGGATFECAVDGAEFSACSSPVSLTALSFGEHRFAVRATVGSVVGTALSYGWTVVDDVPVALGQELRAPADDPAGRDLTLAAVDLDDLTYRIVDHPVHGFLEGVAPDLTYVAFAGYVGPDSFSFVADDGQETSEPATVDVFVTDGLIVPVITLPSGLDDDGVLATTTLDDESYAVVDFTVTATDADTIDPDLADLSASDPGPLSFGGRLDVECSPASGSRFGIGDTTVSCSATDADDNTTTETFVVRVVDDQDPSLTDPGDQTVYPDEPGLGPVSFDEPSATDNSGDVDLACSPASGDVLALGDTTVSCTAIDGSGNTADVSFVVTVADVEAPVFGPVSDQTVFPEFPGVDRVVFAVPAVSDNSGAVDLVCDPASGSVLPLGATTVSCTATDGSGNEATVSFVVTVSARVIPPQELPATGNGHLPLREAFLLIAVGLLLLGVGRTRRQARPTNV